MCRFQSISPQSFVSGSLLVSPPVNVSVKFTISCGSSSQSLAVTVQNGNAGKTSPERTEIRLGLPSKGRMATDTLDLLRDCQLSVKQVNPRQYVAEIPQIPNLEVWFQRPKDVVRKLVSGDLDLGIVGLDTVTEYGQGNEDLVIVHDNLEYGDCHLSIAIPKYGIFKNINSLEELAQMPQWTPERPLRVATGFNYMAPIFLSEKGLKHVTFSTADGALEAAPAMGIADAIVDLVSSGTTLRENNLKEIEGGTMLESQGNEDLVIVHDNLEYGDCHFSIAIPKYGIFENINSLKELAQMPQWWTHERPLRVATGFNYMGLVSSGTTLRENNLKEIEGGIMLESQAVFVASRKSLTQRKGVLDITHEMLERLEAHLRAVGQFKVTANMRGSTAEEVAERILSQPSLSGLQGPTISPVYCKRDGKMSVDYYAIVICVPKKELYKSVKQLRAIGGSGGVLISSPLTYIFDEETPRWGQLLAKLGV